jgi:hypothetical protein
VRNISIQPSRKLSLVVRVNLGVIPSTGYNDVILPGGGVLSVSKSALIQ